MATGIEVRQGGQLQVPIAFQNLQPYCRLIRDSWLDCATNHEGLFHPAYTGKNGAGVEKNKILGDPAFRDQGCVHWPS